MAGKLCAEQISTRNDAVGRSLQQWWDAGTAAGFGALQYENHDGGHSPLPPMFYPTLKQRKATEAEVKAGKHMGIVDTIRTEPTIGNTSMSGPPDQVGSLPRVYLTDQSGSEFLFRQYLNNNLHIFPEHQDYDPGANGVGGWGDMYPVNTPCLLISQGSSGSDMPFVKAMFAIAAALRPEIQQLLIRQHLLAPTLQAVFRQNTNLVMQDADYFTGKAHPPVFPENAIDELRMVTAAQLISFRSLPPVAFLEVQHERTVTVGKDFCERPGFTSQAICTTPSFVGRVFRSMDETQTLRVSAKRSVDLDHRELMYRWVLLQGDSGLVTITPEKDGEEANIAVRWHPPLRAASGIRTHRVDIGLFVGNGLGWSAPAFLSFYMLPIEMRYFDDQGRLLEVYGEAGNPEIGLPASAGDEHWLAMLELIAVVEDSLARNLATKELTKEQLAAVKASWQSLRPLKQDFDKLPKEKRAEPSPQREALTKATEAALHQTAPNAKGRAVTLRAALETVVTALADRPDLFMANQSEILRLAPKSPKTSALTDLRAELKRLTDIGVLVENAEGIFSTEHPPEALTTADQGYLRQLDLTVLSQVLFPGLLERSPAPLFVDARLGIKRAWRDVFRYSADGKRDGWVRHYRGRTYRFDAEGRLIGPDDQAKTVNYTGLDNHLVFDPPPK